MGYRNNNNRGYGEFYPVTAIGKAIATLVMFAAIGILSKLIALVTSTVIAKKIKETSDDLVNETKAVNGSCGNWSWTLICISEF